MEVLSASDILFLQTSALGASAYAASLVWNKYFGPLKAAEPSLPLLRAAKSAKPPLSQPTRSILKHLEQKRKGCIVLYGSQTGTAERFANRFSREALARYNLGCVVADLDDFDYGDLAKLTDRHLVVFILATYGEGEPTDNAIPFQKYLDGLSNTNILERLQYSAFGLGSTSYTHFNAMIRKVDHLLSTHYAQRIGELGLGDEGRGTLEEDFVEWTDSTLRAISVSYSLPEVVYQYIPSFEVTESVAQQNGSRNVFLGEPNKSQLVGRIKGPFTPSNPFPASIVAAKELYTSPDRNCLHLKFDVSGTNMYYDTGDHLAVWPVNSNSEVDLFLNCFGLSSRRTMIIDINATDVSTKLPIPPRTTYESAVRYYLDIGSTVTRQTIRQISNFASSETVRTSLNALADDKEAFSNQVTGRKLTIAQLLSHFHASQDSSLDCSVVKPPFSLILEIIPKLKQRYYSISSSSLVSPQNISITAVVDSVQDNVRGIDFHGVSTSYLSALKCAYWSDNSSSQQVLTHNVKLAHQICSENPRALIHVRSSKFRPPFQPSVPIIMIGPGTGVAPFLAFVQERALQYSQGRKIGRTLLFYGCRRSDEDFLYYHDWQTLLRNEQLGKDVFSMFTAYSRQPATKKAYVQTLLEEQSHLLSDLILTQNAQVYICGNANKMAKGVAEAFAKIFGQSGNANNLEKGFGIIEGLKEAGRWCEDVW